MKKSKKKDRFKTKELFRKANLSWMSDGRTLAATILSAYRLDLRIGYDNKLLTSDFASHRENHSTFRNINQRRRCFSNVSRTGILLRF